MWEARYLKTHSKRETQRENEIKIKRSHPEACAVTQDSFALMELPRFKSLQNQCRSTLTLVVE